MARLVKLSMFSYVVVRLCRPVITSAVAAWSIHFGSEEIATKHATALVTDGVTALRLEVRSVVGVIFDRQVWAGGDLPFLSDNKVSPASASANTSFFFHS